MALFYVGQVELIQQTRKVLKKKVRTAVDKVGPQIYKNFDKMRMVMFDPTSSQKKRIRRKSKREEEEKKFTKSQSHLNLQKHGFQNSLGLNRNHHNFASFHGSMKDGINPITMESRSSRRGSFEYPVTPTDYDLDYLEELELNKAFNSFKDI